MNRLAALAACVLVAACAAKRPDASDPQLPEQVEAVPEAAPRAILEEAAGNLDPTPRALAIRWLVRLDPAPAGGTWGPRGLYDPSAWVQRAAVEGLILRIHEPETRALLAEYATLGQADPYTRCAAGLALAAVGASDVRDGLASAWRAEREPWIVAPLALAAAAHGDPEALAAAATALATGEIGLEPEFLEAVGASGHAELQAALRQAAGAVEEELALPVAVALVQLGDPSGEQALRRALDGPDAEVRLGALDLLVALDHPTSTALLQRARSDSSSLVRWYARLALAARGAEDAEVFHKAWLDPDREVRALAIRCVARAADDPATRSNRKAVRAAQELVPAALADPDGGVRLEAVRAAAHLEMRGLIPGIGALTQDPWTQLRVEAAGVVAHLQAKPA